MTLLSVSLFCLLTIYGSPDRVLLKEDSTIKIPFTDTLMPFVGFSIVAPILLIVLTVYLHIFFGYGLDCERERQSINKNVVGTNEPPIEGIPTLFSLPNPFSAVLTSFVLYGLVPFVLGSLTWKAAARSDMALPLVLMYVTGFVSCSLVFLLLRRWPASPRLWKTPVSCVILLLIIGLMVVLANTRDSWFRRQLHLEHAELPQAWLSGKDMRDAHAKSANLKEALLEQACLERADLTSADLTDARLWNACLARAHLPRANLVNAHLPGANLTRADLTHANLTDADLRGADLTGATLTDATLTRATLTDATLTRTNLTNATLTRANLTRANLTGANLTGANLKTVTDLTQAQVDKACGDENTQLPEGLIRPASCPSASLLLTIRPINFPFPEFQAARRVKHLTLAVAGYPLVTLTGMSADAGFPRQRHA